MQLFQLVSNEDVCKLSPEDILVAVVPDGHAADTLATFGFLFTCPLAPLYQ